MKVDGVRTQENFTGAYIQRDRILAMRKFTLLVIFSILFFCLQRHVDKSCLLCSSLPGFLSADSFSGVTVLC